MEYLEVVNEFGKATGKIKTREQIHTDGDIHKVVKVYIVNRVRNRWKVLLQKRSHTCDAFPSLYDASCAGHVVMDETSIQAVNRELAEEIGCQADKAVYQFSVLSDWTPYYTNNYLDIEYTDIYTIMANLKLDDYTLQTEEVEDLIWFDMEDVMKRLDDSYKFFAIPHKEMAMLMRILDKDRK